MDHDLIIIGGGAGGLGALRAALWSKVDVLMINDGPPGGDCTFTGCVPPRRCSRRLATALPSVRP